MTQAAAPRSFRTFTIIWIGQLFSLTGSGLTGFALGVWVLQRTGSVTQFALISLSTALPGILFAPLAGALVDRWDRRMAMIVSDIGAGLCTLAMALLLSAGRLEVWHIYIAVAISSSLGALQWPAYSAATTQLVPKAQFGRASGMVQLGQAVSQIISPILAGALVVTIGVQGVMLIDVGTLLFALVTLLVVRISRPAQTEEGQAARGSIWREAAYGWTYIAARPGLLGLLLFFAASNLSSSMVGVLFTPLVLSFATPDVLGTLMSVGGAGLLVGSLLMSAWGGPRRRVYGVLGPAVLSGAVLFLAGAPPNVTLLAVAAFFYFLGIPIMNGCSQAIWLSKTAPDVQGRVFSVRRMIAWSSTPIAYLLAGPLADRVFEPLLADGGRLADSVGRVTGTGPGRGIGLIFVLMGGFTIAAAAAGFLYPRVRRLEAEVPDAVADHPSPAPVRVPDNPPPSASRM